MATKIQRVRFFDGQFLKQVDFREEQNYHLHMRRRMNFFLFGQSGVIPLGPDDLKFFALSNVNKTFQVRAGMAMCRRLDLMEGKEIILTEDSGAINLTSHGITTDGTAYVTLHFLEEELKDPPSEGDVDENTRYHERAILSVHSAPPLGTAPGGEEYILLGTIAYNTMTPDYTLRHEARLRTALLQAPPAPSITSVSGTTSATPGSPAVNMVINGLNLSGASAVSFNDPAVTGVVTNATATTVNVTVTASGAATLGLKSFQVTTPGGLASSPTGVGFTVAAPTPVISGINVHTANQGSTNVSATISGSNLAGATAVTFDGTGVTATIQSGGTATTLPITITVTSSASPGPRTFTVTTPSGNANSSGVVGADFGVSVAAPAVTSINVSSVTQGNIHVSAVITGTNLAGATAVTFSGAGVTATVQSGGTATTVPIVIAVAANAAVGARTFTVATPNGNASSGATAVSVLFAPATVDGINIHSGTQGTTVDVIITGTNLAEASEVIFSGAGINTFIQAGVTATSLPVRLVIDANAPTGTRTFVVGTPRGDVSSNGVLNAGFSVALGVRLNSLTPDRQISGGFIDLNGVNIRNPALSAGSPTTGALPTLVQLKKSSTIRAVGTPTVRPDTASGQVVRIIIPDRTGTTWGAKEAVTLELTFSGVTVSLPFTYDD
jgi:hypothetical protein